MLPFIFALLFIQDPTPSPEKPVAVIEGPTTGLPGDLVVLNGTKSVGKGAKWITPDNIQTLQCSTCEFVPTLAFATGTPGKYKFTLVVSMNDEIVYDIHEVEIVGSKPPVVTPPVDPVDPPTPEKGLAELSKQLSISRNDPTTRSALTSALDNQVAVIKQLCRESRCPTLDSAKLMMTAAVDSAFLARKGESRKVDWEVWRKPLYDKINSFKYVNLNDYLNDIEQISKGLK